ncbi:hypothetical protein Btru_023211 [Bulinus truncatus]|nr:hypothetical protein Btru_023211 [Bulinus truncatus]
MQTVCNSTLSKGVHKMETVYNSTLSKGVHQMETVYNSTLSKGVHQMQTVCNSTLSKVIQEMEPENNPALSKAVREIDICNIASNSKLPKCAKEEDLDFMPMHRPTLFEDSLLDKSMVTPKNGSRALSRKEISFQTKVASHRKEFSIVAGEMKGNVKNLFSHTPEKRRRVSVCQDSSRENVYKSVSQNSSREKVYKSKEFISSSSSSDESDTELENVSDNVTSKVDSELFTNGVTFSKDSELVTNSVTFSKGYSGSSKILQPGSSMNQDAKNNPSNVNSVNFIMSPDSAFKAVKGSKPEVVCPEKTKKPAGTKSSSSLQCPKDGSSPHINIPSSKMCASLSAEKHLKQPISKKRKLTFSQPSSPMDSCDTCSNDSSLSHIFSFFKIPRLLSPLAPSPVDICGDGVVKFGSTTPANVMLVTPKAKPSTDGGIDTSKAATIPVARTRVSRAFTTPADGACVSSKLNTPVARTCVSRAFTTPADGACVSSKLTNPFDRTRVSSIATKPADGNHVIFKSRPQPEAVKCKMTTLSHQISQARLMLAHRKSTMLVEPAPVNPALKGLKRKLSSDCGPSSSTKKKKLADLNGYASPGEALTVDLKGYIATKDMTRTTLMEKMLGRVEGEDNSKLLELLPPAVVKCVTDQKDDAISEHLMAMCSKRGKVANKLFPSEKKLVDLIANLYKNSDKHSLMETIWNGIFSKETKQFCCFSLCRLFTGLWKLWGEIEQVRVLVYNVAWCGYLDVVMCILAIIGVWPEVLGVSYPLGVTPVCSVLQYILENILKSEPDKLHQVQNVLNRLCLWEVKPSACQAETLLKSLHESLADVIAKGNYQDQLFQAGKAIELLLIHQGGAWTEEYFIKRLLVSAVMKFISNTTEKDHEAKLVLVTSLLNILCSILMVHPVSNNAGTILVKQVFNKLTNKKSNNFSLEMAYIDALIELTPNCPDVIQGLIKKWQDHNKGRVPANTFSKLQLNNLQNNTKKQFNHAYECIYST